MGEQKREARGWQDASECRFSEDDLSSETDFALCDCYFICKSGALLCSFAKKSTNLFCRLPKNNGHNMEIALISERKRGNMAHFKTNSR